MKKTLTRSLWILLALTLCAALIVTTIDQVNGKKQASRTEQIKKQTKGKVVLTERKKKMRGIYGADHPDKFNLLHKEIRTAPGKTRPDYSLNYRMDEFLKAREMAPLRKATNVTFEERGPGNVSGRTRGLIVDPDDSAHDTWFVGSVSGGIWKTDDAGQTWEDKTSELPTLATSTLAGSPANTDVMYAGTGEGFFNSDAIIGNGVFKSIDHGESWDQLPFTANNLDFTNVNRIVVDPEDEDIVICCNNADYSINHPSTIQKSTDGGTTWDEVYQHASRIQQIVPSPNSFDTLYATINGRGVIKSTDAGDTWDDASEGIGSSNRVELAVSQSNTDILYIAVENGANSDLYISEDAAATWTLVADTSLVNQQWLGYQGWYDNAIEVHPYDPDIVYLGGINIWKATMQEGTEQSTGISSIDDNGTGVFLSWVDWNGSLYGGGIGFADEAFGSNSLDESEYVSVELRFGPGVQQKAHRFEYVWDTGAFNYMDYIDVPFEAWDIDNNIQLTLSFVDWRLDGAFDLEGFDQNDPPREYTFVHIIPYDDTARNMDISGRGATDDGRGITHRTQFFMWPYLTAGATWEPDNLPASTFTLNWENITMRLAAFEQISDRLADRTGPTWAHVDHHVLKAITYDDETFRLIDCNDGGVHYSDDEGVSWIKTFNSYNTTQFYGADKSPVADEFFGGMQDNGTWQSPAGEDADDATAYIYQLSGDGYMGIWHYDDPLQIIGAIYDNMLYKTVDGGVLWTPCTNGMLGAGDGNFSPFCPIIAKINSDPDLLFCTNAYGVWRSDDFADSWTYGDVDNDFWGYSSFYTPVEISEADQRIVWAGAYMDNNDNIQVSTDGGLTFSVTNNFDNMGRVSGLATHPVDTQTAYALFSQAGRPKVLRTTDLGQAWEELSGFGANAVSSNGFPDVAVYDLQVMPYDTDILWACTDIGIFESADDGGTWTYLNDPSFPAVAVWEAKFMDDVLTLATHGRGIWSVTFDEMAGYTPPVMTLTPVLRNIVSQSTGANIIYSLRDTYDSTQVYVNDAYYMTFAANAVVDSNFIYPMTEADSVSANLIAYKDGEEYKSAVKSTYWVPLNDVADSYASDLNDSPEADFYSDSFIMDTPDGFDNPALHSPHPYPDFTELTCLLLTPIRVADSDAYFRYQDVAVIEAGEPGTVYGDDEFWDYVIAEASTDMVNWVELLDGYDCRTHPGWNSAYNTGGDGASNMFTTHSINLLDFFNPGDEILIRFRLFADAYTNGWGWAIDNIEVQETLTGVEKDMSLPTSFALKQNYPNPFNPTTTIEFALPQNEKVSLIVFDALGRQVDKLMDDKMEAGFHAVTWDASRYASGVYFYKIKAGDFTKTKKLLLIK